MGLQNKLTSSLSCRLGQSKSIVMWIRVPGSKVSDHGSSKGGNLTVFGICLHLFSVEGIIDIVFVEQRCTNSMNRTGES